MCIFYAFFLKNLFPAFFFEKTGGEKNKFDICFQNTIQRGELSRLCVCIRENVWEEVKKKICGLIKSQNICSHHNGPP